MKGLFIFLVIVSMLFFIAKLGLTIFYKLKKQNYYNNIVIKCLNDYTILSYVILLYCLSISLYLADDYTIAECNFTLIVLSLAAILFVGEKVYFHVKNRGYFYIGSNIYDLNELALKQEFGGVLSVASKDNFVLSDKEAFEELLEKEQVCDSKKLFKKNLIKTCISNGLGLVLCITILVLGLVRGV